MAILAVTALLSFLLGLLLPEFLELPRAAPLHMILALSIMPLILGAMTYFIPVLTRTGTPEANTLLLPLTALIAGILVAFSLSLTYRLYPVAAILALVAIGGLFWWAHKRSKATLGRPHPGLLWYQLALAALALGLAAIVLAAYWPEQWLPLKRFHLHINTLGFIGLTALGTLRVLLPTAADFPDPQAGPWLMLKWRWLAIGTLLIAIGAAWLPLLAEVGLLLWLIVLIRLIHSVLWLHRNRIWHWHGAATPLATAVIGLLLCLVAGALHGHGVLPASQTNQAFVMAFLLPLVTGAATHLLPLWLYQKESQEKQQGLRNHLGHLSSMRSMLFVFAGALALLAQPWAFLLSVIALVHFLFQLSYGVLQTRRS